MIILIGTVAGVSLVLLTIFQWGLIEALGNYGIPLCSVWVLFSALFIGFAGKQRTDDQMKRQNMSENVTYAEVMRNSEDVYDVYME